MTDSNWLDTSSAARALGIAPCTLKRKRDINGGFLEEGKHYRFKTDAPNSPAFWDVETIRRLLHERGMRLRREAAAARTEQRAQEFLDQLQREASSNG